MTAISNPIPAKSAGEPPWNQLGRPTLGVTAMAATASVLAGVTFGLLPAIVWPWRWASLLDRDRPYYRDLANWWRTRVTAADADKLDDILDRLRPRPILMVLPWLAAAFTFASALLMLIYQRPDYHDLLPRLADCTYRFRPGVHVWGTTLDRHVHDVWLWGLTFAYACHFYAVRVQARCVGDLARWTNAVTRGDRVRTVRSGSRMLGLNALWVIGAIVLCGMHAWWAIPMVLAGASQRRYADVISPRLKQGLSAQAGDAMTLVGSSGPARFCPTPNCGNRLPAPAAFCPRCGSATVAADRAEA